MSGGTLGRAAFGGHSDLKSVEVHLPQRGGHVRIREMCAGEILEFFNRFKADSAATTIWLMGRSVIDDTGARLFSDDEAQILADSLNRDEFKAIHEAILSLNGIGEDQEKN